jgi:hypothetical protein
VITKFNMPKQPTATSKAEPVEQDDLPKLTAFVKHYLLHESQHRKRPRIAKVSKPMRRFEVGSAGEVYLPARTLSPW